MIQMLQNSLLQLSKKDIIEINTEITDEPLVVVNNSNTQPQTFDGLIKIAELQMEIKNLEDQLNAERTKLQLKSGELADLEERLDERQTLITRLQGSSTIFTLISPNKFTIVIIIIIHLILLFIIYFINNHPKLLDELI